MMANVINNETACRKAVIHEMKREDQVRQTHGWPIIKIKTKNSRRGLSSSSSNTKWRVWCILTFLQYQRTNVASTPATYWQWCQWRWRYKLARANWSSRHRTPKARRRCEPYGTKDEAFHGASSKCHLWRYVRWSGSGWVRVSYHGPVWVKCLEDCVYVTSYASRVYNLSMELYPRSKYIRSRGIWWSGSGWVLVELSWKGQGQNVPSKPHQPMWASEDVRIKQKYLGPIIYRNAVQ